METATTVKFEDFEYKRPDVATFRKRFLDYLSEFESAYTADAQYEILLKLNELRNEFDTMRSIASIRYTINTDDDFYSAEHEFFDDVNPEYVGCQTKLYNALMNSKFKRDLEQKTGSVLYKIAGTYIKTFSPEVTEDLKKENSLVTQYTKIIASAKIFYEGEERNIAGMSPFMQSTDRQVRKKASEAKWNFFQDNENELDRIYDELVKTRTRIAHKLGYKNFVQLGYDRMERTGYTPDDVRLFRESVKEFITPATIRLNDLKKERLGLKEIFYYDSQISFKDGNPVPKGSPEWIVRKAKEMYEQLSSETNSFINLMIDHDLMDLYNRHGKSAGGYCSYIPNYKSPFIFSNMNGTSDDVRVLTHEAGHAFQAYQSRNFDLIEYRSPTLEACEIHSMSMEFITWPWMELFFEEDTDKFLYLHLTRALRFLPYGVTVDEFQHWVYEHPEATPEERKSVWSDIERKYNPQINYDENDFLKRGGFWFHQGHIFKRPFYYIDYCLAQVCALQFWKKCNNDCDTAWEDYLRLCKAGGSKPFLELVDLANLQSPFVRCTMESIVGNVMAWTLDAAKEFV